MWAINWMVLYFGWNFTKSWIRRLYICSCKASTQQNGHLLKMSTYGFTRMLKYFLNHSVTCLISSRHTPHQQSTHTPSTPHHAATKQAQYSRMSHTLNILLSFSFFIFLKYPTNQANKIPKSDMHNLRQSIHKINKKLRSKTFSVPGKRTNRSLARTKACKI